MTRFSCDSRVFWPAKQIANLGGSGGTRSRYSGYNVLDKWSSPDWDDQTREVVGKRLFDIPEVRFFTDSERCTLEAISDRVVPQPERSDADKFLSCRGSMTNCSWINATVTATRTCRRNARLGGAVLRNRRTARLFAGKRFADLETTAQDEVLRRVERGDAPGASWTTLPARRFFTSVLADDCEDLLRAPVGVERSGVQRPLIAARAHAHLGGWGGSVGSARDTGRRAIVGRRGRSGEAAAMRRGKRKRRRVKGRPQCPMASARAGHSWRASTDAGLVSRGSGLSASWALARGAAWSGRSSRRPGSRW